MEINLFIIVMLLSTLVLAFAGWGGRRFVLWRLQMANCNEFDFLVLIGDNLRLEKAQEQGGGAMARCSLFIRNMRNALRLFTAYAARAYGIFYTCAYMVFCARFRMSLMLLSFAPNGRRKIGTPIER